MISSDYMTKPMCQSCEKYEAYARVSIDAGESSQVECMDCSRNAFESDDERTLVMVI